MLVTRDILSFHLPLQTTLQELLAGGGLHVLPEWNPLVHAGQPILSNPNYAAFYPLSWPTWLLPPSVGLSVVVLLHVAIAAVGAWWLARRLGCGVTAAALATLGYAAGPFLSLVTTLIFLRSMAWFPWILFWGLRALGGIPGRHGVRSSHRPGPSTHSDAATAPAGRRRRRSVAMVALLLAVQLFAGEPVAVLISALALGCLALGSGRLRRLPRRVAILAIVAALATLVGAVQILPTGARLSGTERGSGVDVETAADWSMPPERLAELAYPRIWGDPLRDEEQLYFGWKIHDRSFPYIVLLSPGLLLTILAAAALLRFPIPYRHGWTLMATVGAVLALGRHTPLYEATRALPLLEMARFPEKFILLTTSAVVFAGALGWEHVARRSGRRGGPHPPHRDTKSVHLFPTALAIVAALPPLAMLAVGAARPEIWEWYVRSHSVLQPSPDRLAAAVGFLQTEAVVSTVLALLVALLLTLLGRRRLTAVVVGLGAVLVLSSDVGYRGRGLVQTLPAERVLEPPPIARQVRRVAPNARALRDGASGPSSGTPVLGRSGRQTDRRPRGGESVGDGYPRIFSDAWLVQRPEIHLKRGPVGFQQYLSTAARLDPYSANIWGIGYAVQDDYDLMLTPWADRSLRLLEGAVSTPEHVMRILGAWNVEWLVQRLSEEEEMAQAARAVRRSDRSAPWTEEPLPTARAVRHPAPLPRFRSVRRVETVDDPAEAAERLADRGFDVSRGEICIGGELSRRRFTAAEIDRVDGFGDRIELAYRADEAAFLVAAVTYDTGWEVRIDGERAPPPCPTALGQIGVEVPAGEHTVELAYRDPWVRVGAAVTLVTLLAGALLLRPRRRRSPFG